MPKPPRAPRLGARFDELLFREDLAHATQAGQTVARKTRRQFEDDGVTTRELRRCDAEHRDGTRLANCVKVYLPGPGEPWRMIFEFQRDPAAGEIYLAYLAFGVGHPQRPWQPSAYHVAHRRLHPDD